MRFMKQYLSIIAFILLSSPTISLATCIIIIKKPTEIIVGAESKRIVYLMDNTGHITNVIDTAYCKIHHVGRYYFAISGFDDGPLLDSAIQACTTHNTLSEVVKSYSLMIKKCLEQSVENIRMKNKNKYLEQF